MRKIILTVFFTVCMSWLSEAQCAMCRAALETEETGLKAEAVNDGIVYLMAFPYILLLAGGVVIYKIMKNKKKNKI